MTAVASSIAPSIVDVADDQPSTRSGWWGLFDRWWFAGCAIALIVGSDYKFRTRDATAAVSGGVDTAILVELALYAAVAGVLLLRQRHPPRLGRIPFHLVMCCFYLGTIGLSATYAVYPGYAVVRAVQMGVIIALVLAAASTSDLGIFHRFAHAYLVLVTASVAYGFARPSVPLSRLQVGRFTWFAIHPTVSGVLAGLAVVISLAYAIAGRSHRTGPRWPLPAYLVVLAVTVAATLGAHTRGAVLAMAVGVVVVLVLARVGRGAGDVVAGLVLVAVVVRLYAFDQIQSYLRRGQTPEQLTTLSSRTEFWSVALEAVRDQPMYGYGVGSARGLFVEQTGLGGGHNAVVNVLVELGAVGFVCWAALIVAIFVAVLRIPWRHTEVALDRVMIIAIVLFLVVDGIFFEGVGAVTNVASTWLFVCSAWLAVVLRTVARPDSRAQL